MDSEVLVDWDLDVEAGLVKYSFRTLDFALRYIWTHFAGDPHKRNGTCAGRVAMWTYHCFTSLMHIIRNSWYTRKCDLVLLQNPTPSWATV